MSVMGPGSNGFGDFAPSVQATGSNGAVYQIDGSGNWYNTSAGEELSQSDAAELGLPAASNFYGGPLPFLGGQNAPPPNNPASIFNKYATRGRPSQTPRENPGPVRPGEPNMVPAQDPAPPPPPWLKVLQDLLDLMFGGGQGTYFEPFVFINPCNTPQGAIEPTCRSLSPAPHL